MTDHPAFASQTSVSAPTEEWEAVIDALWLLHHRARIYRDSATARFEAERYARMARRLSEHLYATPPEVTT